jgi:hypothetical protein
MGTNGEHNSQFRWTVDLAYASLADLRLPSGSQLSHIQDLQQHLEQFVAHIRGTLSAAAARFADMRGVP